jgi:hypothetical protein
MGKLVVVRGLIGGLAFLESASTAFLRESRRDDPAPLE